MPSEKNVGQTKVEALQSLVLSPELEHLEDLLAEFNLFDVLGIARRELQHSAFLAWLLDPQGSHGLRDYFLRRFLSEATAKAGELGIAHVTPLDVDGWKLRDIEVATERHNIDILLIGENDRFVCLIENKIGGGEHSGQLSRYFKTVKTDYKGLIALPVFLTPDGVGPDAEDDAESWVPIGYEKVADLIDRTLKTRGSTISAGVAGFLDQYARTIRRHVLDITDNKDNIDELALQIYNNHRVAIDLIIAAKPGLEVKGWDIIHSAVDQHAPLLKADHHGKIYHRFYSPELDDIPELKRGSGWTESGRILLFEFKYRERTLALIIGPGPEETRKRLYNLAQRDGGVPGVKMIRRKNLSGTWHSVYSKTLIRKQSTPEPDYEKARSQVEQVIAEFYENDYWPIVNAIRGEFGLPAASRELDD